MNPSSNSAELPVVFEKEDHRLIGKKYVACLVVEIGYYKGCCSFFGLNPYQIQFCLSSLEFLFAKIIF